MLGIVALVLLLALLATIFIFGDLPQLRGSLLHRCKSALVQRWRNLSRQFHHVNSRYFDGRLERLLGWAIPGFYVAVVSFCLYKFFESTYPVLPFASSRGHQSYIFASIIMIYGSTYLATFSNAGIVTPESLLKVPRFPNNQLIFFNGRTCSTCHLEKPARSKHCSVCGHCVMLFDHHCLWVNNCIGYYNYRWFVAYLVANINFLMYGAVLNIWTLRSYKRPQQGWWQLIKSSETMKITGIFAILCVIFVVVTSAFAALHVRYLYLGVTTNEYDKWAEVEHLVGLGALYHCPEFDPPYVELAMVYEGDSYRKVYISLDDEHVVFKEGDSVVREPVTSMEHQLDNVYDLGFWNNIRQRVLLQQ